MDFTDRISANKKAVAEFIALHKQQWTTKQIFKDEINKLIQELKVDRIANINKILFYLDVKRAL